MRIAWISGEPAANAVGGGGTYNRTVLRLLSAIPAVREVVEIPLHPARPVQPHRLRQAMALLRSVFSRLPAKALFHIPIGGLRTVSDRLAESDPDIVVISSADLLPCRQAIGSRPFILVAHNIEQKLYGDQVANAARRLPLAGWFLRRDLARLRAMEDSGARDAALVIAISLEDAAFLEGRGTARPPFALPPLFPGPLPSHDRAPPARPLRLALMARMSWWPNRMGCDWLVHEVLSRLPEGVAELHLYGPGSDRMGYPGNIVKGHGFVEDLAEVWRDNHIAICPIHQGSGVNVKLAESVFNGMPLLTTPHGARGLPPLDSDPAVRIVESAEDWISFLCSGEAVDFARQTPAAGTRLLFADETYSRRLNDAVTALKEF